MKEKNKVDSKVEIEMKEDCCSDVLTHPENIGLFIITQLHFAKI